MRRVEGQQMNADEQGCLSYVETCRASASDTRELAVSGFGRPAKRDTAATWARVRSNAGHGGTVGVGSVHFGTYHG